MARHLRTAHRQLHRHAFTLLLLLLVPAFARVAGAAAPTFIGTFTYGALCSPRGIGVGPSGDVYLGSDCLNPFMARFNSAGAIIGGWDFFPPYVGSPNGVAVDGSGNVFVTDYEGNRVHKYTPAGAFITSWATLAQPVDVAVNGAGEVYVLCALARRVQRFTNGGALLATFGSTGGAPGQFQDPSGIGIDASGRVHITDHTRARVMRFLPGGSFDMEFATVPGATDVEVGTDGNVYVVRWEGGGAIQYSATGTPLLTFGALDGGYRIAVSATGALYISEQTATRVSKFQIEATTPTTRTTFARVKALYR